MTLWPQQPILTPKDCRDILEGAVRVLDEVGIQCDHEKAIALLIENGGVRHQNGRIYLDKDAMMAFYEQRRAEALAAEAVAAPAQWAMGGQWNCLELCDPETNQPRPATLEDCVAMTKLAVSLGAKTGPIPVAPGVVPPRLRTLECERIALLHTPGMGGWLTATDADEVRLLRDMHRAAGRRYSLGLEGLITPLKLNPVIFDTYFEHKDDPDIDIGIMGGIPVAGSTAALVFPANFVLPLAEDLALDFLSRSLSGGKLRCANLRLEPFDMRWANLAYGTPEQCLLIQAGCELRRELFGSLPRHGTFRTNGKVVEAQTMLERSMSFLWQAALGARIFGSVGQISLDEVYSPVQAVLDRETLEYGRRLFTGISERCWDRETDVVQIIAEGVADNGFLAHDSTVGMFRAFYGAGRMSEASNLNGWRTRGAVKLEDKARTEAKRLIDAYDWHLDEQRSADVEKIYRQGVALLQR